MGTNTPDVLTDTTADLGFALLMATARRMSESERWMRNGQWLKWELGGMLGVDVHHTTLGIMGMGRIGQALAKRALGFDMKIIYHNRTRLSADVESEYQAKYVDKETLLKQADHVILVMPYSPESHHFIGARELELMKPTATLINIARGGIVDDQALASALKNNRIFAAGLDVFEGEPNLIPELLQVPNIVLTPHIGSASKMTRYAMMNLAIDNLLAGLHGEKPKNLLNPEAFQRL
jgi:gluconate 2-dehydrogenase